MRYRNYTLETYNVNENGKFYTEGYIEGKDIIFGAGDTIEESEQDAQKNIDEYLDKYGE